MDFSPAIGDNESIVLEVQPINITYWSNSFKCTVKSKTKNISLPLTDLFDKTIQDFQIFLSVALIQNLFLLHFRLLVVVLTPSETPLGYVLGC